MITRECVLFTLLLNYVLSSPVSSDHMEKEDVKVMKCIVEVITEAMSMPHPMPVSQECLDTLRRDERLISILRHQNFLKELQEIAIEGATERAKQMKAPEADHVTNNLGGTLRAEKLADQELSQLAGDPVSPDQSMLFALKPGERGAPAEKREAVVEDDVSHFQFVSAGGEPKSIEKANSKLRKSSEQEKKAMEKNVHRATATVGERQEHNGKTEAQHWNKASKLEAKLLTEKQTEEEEAPTAQRSSMMLELPHHSKEDSGEEVQELQMMANKEPVERREEDGSGSRKAEDHEIESLAAIESELENMAQKLHDLRREPTAVPLSPAAS
ncbi:chromogranin-A-like isoform X2 [Arapaima gigas]